MSKMLSCVVGFPVKHSLSPLMHNEMYKKHSVDAHYDAHEIKAEGQSEFEEQIQDLIDKGYVNFNVTMPYKGNACLMCDELDEVAQKLGSVNTILFRDGKLKGYSTDGEGLIRSLDAFEIKNKPFNVLIIGAGGAAVSIGEALAKTNCKISVSARRLEQSESLKNAIGNKIHIVDFETRNNNIGEFDIIINATSIGMTKDSIEDNSCPIDTSSLEPSQIVIDTIYNPLETTLLKQAKAQGCKTFNGLGMLAGQGEIAFELMTGVKIKYGDMYDVLKENDN